ncbi:hypothetical protein FOA52_016190 [Chlamydomonas sp. UWO 241]|nr:hypothetical protein FOA52_016190 [Chlamydomonas sp. UWO 241]
MALRNATSSLVQGFNTGMASTRSACTTAESAPARAAEWLRQVDLGRMTLADAVARRREGMAINPPCDPTSKLSATRCGALGETKSASASAASSCACASGGPCCGAPGAPVSARSSPLLNHGAQRHAHAGLLSARSTTVLGASALCHFSELSALSSAALSRGSAGGAPTPSAASCRAAFGLRSLQHRPDHRFAFSGIAVSSSSSFDEFDAVDFSSPAFIIDDTPAPADVALDLNSSAAASTSSGASVGARALLAGLDMDAIGRMSLAEAVATMARVRAGQQPAAGTTAAVAHHL